MISHSERRSGPGTNGTAGFSLLETLVVLAIVAMVVAVAGPAMRDPSGRRALDAATVEIASLLRAARAEAVLSGSETHVSVNIADRRVMTSWDDATVLLPDGVALQVTSARQALLTSGAPSIRFFPDGSATGGEILLDAPGAHGRISIEWLSGRVLRETSPRE